jgi:rhodanese-related sulfurtransferase
MFMNKNFISISASILIAVISTNALAEAEEDVAKPVYITHGMLKSTVEDPDSGQIINIQRIQDRSNLIDVKYARTSRGKIHSMNPFKPYPVETVGELEVIDYIEKISDGDDSFLIIDTRKRSWYEVNGHIPLSINIPAKEFKYDQSTVDILSDVMGVITDNDIFDYTYAKTLIMYCNGIWCGKTPQAIKKLISFGYPAHKLKYYRGGMQSWKGLGLTIINVFNRDDEVID